ncbi:MAG: PIN domain-containing protein [Pigmentiphaga sp.]
MTEAASERAERRQQIKSKLLDGSIGAISIDTCIFSRAGYRLDQGNLRRLEQFKGNAFRLIFSEVTLKEVIRHIAGHSEEEKNKFVTGLRGISKFWSVDSAKQAAVTSDLLQGIEPKELAKKRVKDFATRCGAHVVEAKQALDVSELLKCYFETSPPFEASGDKKAEFPDAITLLSLESWAKKENTSVLFVTADKGCARYCEKSTHLYAIDDLGSALTLIQERDSHRAQMCAAIDRQIALGNYPNLLNMIESAIAEDIWSIDWIPEADAALYYDPEMQEVELVSASFLSGSGNAGLQAVDYCDGSLVTRATVSIEIEASCNFTFSVKDGIDKDMVCVGGAEVSANDTFDVDVLITFSNLDGDEPEIEAVELVPARRHIDFGSVGPDYGDEDPNSEYY